MGKEVGEISRFFVAPLCEFLLSVYAPTPYPKISTPEYSQSELSKIELVFLAATPSFPCKPCGGEAVSLESRSDVAFPSLPRDFEGYWHKLTSPQPEKSTCKKCFHSTISTVVSRLELEISLNGNGSGRRRRKKKIGFGGFHK